MRTRAVKAFARHIDPSNEVVINGLVRATSDKNREVRGWALEALTKIPVHYLDKTIPIVIDAIETDTSSQNRLWAVRVLKKAIDLGFHYSAISKVFYELSQNEPRQSIQKILPKNLQKAWHY